MKANENVMDEQGLVKFLVSKAEDIDAAILEKANRNFFDEQITAFCRLREEFQQEVKKAQEAAEDNPELRFSDDDARPPEEGMMPEEHYVLETPPKGFWRWELPFNPDAYLVRFEAESMNLLDLPEEEPPNEEIRLACESALWAAIYDDALEVPACDRLCKDNNEWPPFWLNVSTVAMGGDQATLDQRVVQLKRAYRHIMAKLPVGQDKQERSKEETSEVDEPPARIIDCMKQAAEIFERIAEIATEIVAQIHGEKASAEQCDALASLFVSLKFDESLEWLQCHEPDFAKDMPGRYDQLWKSEAPVSGEYDDGRPVSFHAIDMEISATELARKLRHRVKMAQEHVKQDSSSAVETKEETSKTDQPAAARPKGKTGKNVSRNQWKLPRGYIGSKSIVNDHNVPRSTLQGWAEQDKANVKKDPQTKENYYLRKWFEQRLKNYRPRSKT